MSSNNLPLLDQIRARVSKTLKYGVQLNISTEESKKLLRRHVNRKTNLVVMIVDINKSTQMSLSLPENRFSLMTTDLCSRNKHCCIRLWWICLQV